MSTPNNFHVEDAVLDALDAADQIPVYDTSTGKTSRMTGAQSQAATITVASTAAAMTSNGVTTISSGMNGKGLTIAAPALGQWKGIAWLNSTSSATTITASTDASVTFDGTNCIMTALGKAQSFVELVGLSTSRFAVVGASTSGVFVLSTS